MLLMVRMFNLLGVYVEKKNLVSALITYINTHEAEF
jgi:hypothetical protein